MARQAIEAPIPRPPRFGIVAATQAIDDGVRWQEGFKFAPEACGNSGVRSVDCNGATDEMIPDENPAVVEGDPFQIWAADKCSTFGWQARDYQGRARRQLETTRSFQIANELWRGDLARTDNLVNLALTDPSSDIVTNGPASELSAMACLEAGLATCNKGRQGMIHITPQYLTHLVTNGTVRLDGSTYTSPSGHIVVPDAGYDGSGPISGVTGLPTVPGDSQWAFATSLIQLRLAPVDVFPGELSQALDRSVNSITYWAQQLVAYEWDECCLIAAEVDLPVCLTGGS